MGVSKITKGEYILDNSGERVTLGEAVDPEHGTCIAIIDGFSSRAVSADTWYIFTAVYYINKPEDVVSTKNNVLFSTEGVVSTQANIDWVCPMGRTILMHIPAGKTTLYYDSDAGGEAPNNIYGYLRKLA